jgi:hypothetical protein
MTQSPFSLTVPADVRVDLHGHRTAVVRLPVRDTGKTPLEVTAFTADLGRGTTAASWVQASPASFTLQPGQTRLVVLRITVPAGEQGTHTTDVGFRAAAPAGQGNVQVGGAVATSVSLVEPGRAPAGIQIHKAASVHPGNGGTPLADQGGPLVALALGGTVLIAGVLASLVAVKTRRHRARLRRYDQARTVAPAALERVPVSHRRPR